MIIAVILTKAVDEQRHAAARRPAVGPRGARVRGLDRGHVRRRRRAPLPDLVDRAVHGVPRRPDPGRVGRPLDARGSVRRPARRARDARRSSSCELMLWTAREQDLVEKAEAVAAQRLRAVLELPRRSRRARRPTAGVRRRQRRERRVSARALRREDGARRRRAAGCQPGRPRRDRHHRLAVRRLPPVAARVADPRGQLPPRRRHDRDVAPGELLPDTWNLPE